MKVYTVITAGQRKADIVPLWKLTGAWDGAIDYAHIFHNFIDSCNCDVVNNRFIHYDDKDGNRTKVYYLFTAGVIY